MREELLLQVEDVRRSFDQGRITALNGVSAAVGRGERLAVVGRSGSGKSCLLNMMAGLDVPTSGRVLWQDQPVISRRHWAAIRQQSIGIVFQEFHLLPTLTAQQNVELALMPGDLSQTEQTRRAAAMLDRVGLREGNCRPSFQAASGRGLPLRGRWCAIHCCFSPMSPPAIWTRQTPKPWRHCCSTCRANTR